LTSAPSDQAYGGADVEQPGSDAAIRSTTGLVLSWNGRVVRAPYHSTCGGQTAAPSEVWQGANDDGYLRSVSDHIPGGDRAWCDISPRYRWERAFDRTALEEAVDRYVRANGTGMIVAGGSVRGVHIEQETPSGRVGTLVMETDGGALRLRGNAIRYALRGVGGEILNSTYFSLEPVIGRDGRLMQLTVRGAGNGHGIGMCQWGAIGRARAGYDARAILAAYYPGTVLTRLP
ncbi:MAG: SpoIID/LytB domain-containing protein, partial [Gemmatimonadaceae bacterium]